MIGHLTVLMSFQHATLLAREHKVGYKYLKSIFYCWDSDNHNIPTEKQNKSSEYICTFPSGKKEIT